MRLAAIGLVLGIAVVAGWVVLHSVFASSTQNTAEETALAYARQRMVWINGPTVRSSRRIRITQLAGALATDVPGRTRQDVNVPDLAHRFGANRRVDMVVVAGTFNSLPPDEGVTVNGVAVVLIDVQSGHPFFITF